MAAPVVGPVVVAPAAFKGALSAVRAARAIANGLEQARPDVDIRLVPMADGGEGTLDALLAAVGGRRIPVRVADPLGREITAEFGELADGTAVVELARASGYELLASSERDPERTTTFGTGQLIAAALDRNPRRLVVTLGGSATNDGGLGLLRALGVRPLGGDGRELDGCGGDLLRLEHLDVSGLDPRIGDIPIEVACDVQNPFFGPDGAATVFAPQKGADEAAVARLDAGLQNVARVVRAVFGIDLQRIAGAGAAGGAAGALVAVVRATIVRGADLIATRAGLDAALEGAALSVTGEGRLDEQTRQGKAPAEVAARAAARTVPCIGVFGGVDLGGEEAQALGLTAVWTLRPPGSDLDDAIRATESDLVVAGARLARWLVTT